MIQRCRSRCRENEQRRQCRRREWIQAAVRVSIDHTKYYAGHDRRKQENNRQNIPKLKLHDSSTLNRLDITRQGNFLMSV